VTVGISLFNYEREVDVAVRSVLASDYHDYEIVIVDDSSSDSSARVAAELARANPEVPLLVLAHAANRGPSAARNTFVAHGRGELVFVLDADNVVYPPLMGRLVEALDADPDAAFAFATLAVYEGEEPVGLLSHQPWDPRRLRVDNHIDAMAMVRRAAIVEVGGYCTDRRLMGYEDYDLWCRFAERGRYGVHVPEILGRYQRSQHSMSSLTLIDTSVARSLLRARAPRVWDGERVAELSASLPEARLVATPAVVRA
jgi:glycosyltransferase involved in cell wall biosynthesis